MAERQIDRDYGAIVPRNMVRRESEPSEHERLVRTVEVLPEDIVRKGLITLLEAIDPQIDCICSDLSKVNEGEVYKCAYHTSRIGWIVHQARNFLPSIPES